MEPRIVIVGFKPKLGHEEELHGLIREHHSILKGQGLVTERIPIVMEANDGTIIEVFEWKSKSAIEQAHTNPVVQQMWTKYSEACEYVPVATIAETTNLFADFTPFY
jgi:quinol monooxygenase YgiN